MEQFYIPTKQSNLAFYQAVPLYFQDRNSKFILYKPAGNKLDNTRIEQGLCPEKLFIKKSDELKAMRAVHRSLQQQLIDSFEKNNHGKAKNILINSVEEAFSRPISASLKELPPIVNISVSACEKEPDLTRNLIFVPRCGYNLFVHSVNVMVHAIDFGLKERLSIPEIKTLGLSALLHDVGKTKIDPDVLKVATKLADDEFEEYQTHTTHGYRLISKCKFSDPDVKLTTLQHHERIDGRGYPNKIKRISKTAQLVGLIDCYESLTKDDRPYRNALDSLKALTVLKNEVEGGKFNRKLFEKFAYSLL